MAIRKSGSVAASSSGSALARKRLRVTKIYEGC